MVYVFECEECGEKLERDFPMGEAPPFINSDCGTKKAKARRVFLPLPHRWRDTRPYSEAIVEGAREIKNSGRYEIETSIT